jgi:hypothetical protein
VKATISIGSNVLRLNFIASTNPLEIEGKERRKLNSSCKRRTDRYLEIRFASSSTACYFCIEPTIILQFKSPKNGLGAINSKPSTDMNSFKKKSNKKEFFSRIST